MIAHRCLFRWYRSHRSRWLGARFWMLLGSTGCASHSGAAPKAMTSRSPAALGPLPGAPSVAWSKKTREQKMEYMGLVVFPRMRAVFRAEDPTAYAVFRCQTCHGKDMEAAAFAMPHSLHALPAADPLKAALEYDERKAVFMRDKVEPEMRALVAKDDPETERRFGCLSCHLAE